MRNTRLRDWLVMTDNPFEKYVECFGGEFTDRLRGKAILEIGPGRRELFAQEMVRRGNDVYTLSPSYTRTAQENQEGLHPHITHSQIAHINGKEDVGDDSLLSKIKRIGGYAEKTQLPNDAFDYVVGLFSLPRYSKSIDEFKTFCENIFSALTLNGEARFFPLYTDELDYSPFIPALEALKEAVPGFSFEIAPGLMKKGLRRKPSPEKILIIRKI